METLVSVIVAAYNIENYIDKCIESIINQTYQNLEILIINDGSKDNTYKNAFRFQEKDNRVRVLNKQNGGLSDARNYGLDNCNGDFIVFVDGDDYLFPEMISKLCEAQKERNADLCICNIQNVDEDGKKLDSPSSEMIKPGLHSKKEMLDFIAGEPNWFWIVAWNKLYKKSIFDNLRFTKGKIHEDEFLIHRLIDLCDTIYIVPDKLYYYVQRKNSITHSDFTISNMDVVEALLDRADLYIDKNCIRSALKILYKARTLFIDGYLALENRKIRENKKRLKELHQKYRYTFRKCKRYSKNSKDTFLLGLFDKSVILAVYSSGNYRHSRRYL